MSKIIITTTELETLNIAKSLAEGLKGGEVICLTGTLGAGKTVFSKGIAAGFGYKKNVNSPTFVVMKVYTIKNHVVSNLVHIDAYRLKNEEDIKSIGAEEYFNRTDSVTLIEWPEKIKGAIPDKAIWIDIEIKNQNERIITIKN